MNSLNSILLEGVLLDNPVEHEKRKCSFTIVTESRFKMGEENQKEVSHFDIETFSNLAESCLKHLRKGRGVRVVGRVKQLRWTDDNNDTRSKVIIIAEHVEFKPVVARENVALETL